MKKYMMTKKKKKSRKKKYIIPTVNNIDCSMTQIYLFLFFLTVHTLMTVSDE